MKILSHKKTRKSEEGREEETLPVETFSNRSKVDKIEEEREEEAAVADEREESTKRLGLPGK